MEGQPIGRELFHQFCSQDSLLSHCTRFLEEVGRLELLVDEKYSAAAHNVHAQYLAKEVSCCILTSQAMRCVCVCVCVCLREGETGGDQ